MIITLGIDAVTPSLNKLLKWHWSKRVKLRDQFSIALLVAIRNSANHESFAATGKRRLTIVRFAKKLCDTDNLHGGMKPLIDAIRGHRLIVDDSPEWCEQVPLQYKATKKTGERERTEIVLEDL